MASLENFQQEKVHHSSGQLTSHSKVAEVPSTHFTYKKETPREIGPPLLTHLKGKTDWGFPYVLGPDTKPPNPQEILHLFARRAGSYRRHCICHCVVAHTKRPYVVTLVFTPTEMPMCSYVGFPAQALLTSNCF